MELYGMPYLGNKIMTLNLYQLSNVVSQSQYELKCIYITTRTVIKSFN